MQNVCCEIGTKIKGKMEPRVFRCVLLITVAIVGALSVATAEESVLTLDHSNFTQVVSKHDFIVVEFYAPWCGHCKNLAPEYEKAAQELSNHDPPIVLAKIDVDDESNRDIATEFNIQGFPTIKILRNGGKSSQEYNGPREADGIVYYLKKQLGPASDEIKSVEDAASLINENSVFIVGVFPKFSGKEFENFMTLAEKLRSDFPFGHTLDAKHLLDPKHLPRGRAVSKPTLRLLKPFDELYVDFEDLQVDAMEKFIQESSIPTITTWNNDPINQEYLGKFFDSSDDKAMLFVNFTEEHDSFHPIYKEVAASYKGKGIRFLLGDVDLAQNAFGYFGLKPEDAPALVIDTVKGEKYLKPSVEPKEIAQWVKDYKDGLLKPFIKSQPIPEVNDEPVKVVVHDSLQDVVFSSGKNVLMEFYAPWCGHCKKLAPILDEVATSFANDPEILIAKYDAEANDVPSGTFDVKGFPTLYFKSASGKLSLYDGERTKEGIIDFIQKNRDNPPQLSSAKSGTVEADSLKDEL